MLEQQPHVTPQGIFCGWCKRATREVRESAGGEDRGQETADDADRRARLVAEDVEQGDEAQERGGARGNRLPGKECEEPRESDGYQC